MALEAIPESAGSVRVDGEDFVRTELEMTELEVLKAELEWAIAANSDRPRTELVLKWAAETLDELTPIKAVEEVKA